MIAANVSSVTPVSEYRGDVYTQSVKLTLSNGTTVTVFDGVASLSAGVKIERVRLAGQAVEVERRDIETQPSRVQPVDGEHLGEWAHRVYGTVVADHDGHAYVIDVDGLEVEIELASTLTETPETAQLRVGSDVSVVVNRLDLDDYDHVTDEK